MSEPKEYLVRWAVHPTPVPQWHVRLVYRENGREYVVNVYAPTRDLAIRRAVGECRQANGGHIASYTAVKTEPFHPVLN